VAKKIKGVGQLPNARDISQRLVGQVTWRMPPSARDPQGKNDAGCHADKPGNMTDE